jgi:hypothetical protein
MDNSGLALDASNIIVSNGEVVGELVDNGDGTYSVDYEPEGPGPVTIEVRKNGITIVPPQRVAEVRYELSAGAVTDRPLFPTKINVTLSEAVELGIANFIISDPNNTGTSVQSVSKISDYEYDLNLTGIVSGGQITLAIEKDGYVFTESPISIYIMGDVSLSMAYVDNDDPRLLNLQFTGPVDAEDSAGLTMTGVADTLSYSGKKDDRTLQFRLGSKVFKPADVIYVSYNAGSGTVTNPDGATILSFANILVTNTSVWAAPGLVAAQIPAGYPNHLVLTFNKEVAVENIDGFTLTGTTAEIQDKVSEGVTIDILLSEPVDAAENNIRVSITGGVKDTFDQNMPSVSNFTVTNNSAHTAIGPNNANVPNTNNQAIVCMMEGAVVKTDEYGTGFSYTVDGGEPVSLAGKALTISDGTITIACDKIYAGQQIVLFYDGTHGLKDAAGDTIPAFEIVVTNNSDEQQGFPAHDAPSNLGILALGHEPQSAAEVTEVINMISATIRSGNMANCLQTGDYLHKKFLTVAAGHDAGGACAITSFPATESTGDPDFLKLVLVSKNPYNRGEYPALNGNNFDHVVLQWHNNPVTHYVNPSNTNAGGYEQAKLRAYLLNEFREGAKAAGIPFDTNVIAHLSRRIAVSYQESNKQPQSKLCGISYFVI